MKFKAISSQGSEKKKRNKLLGKKRLTFFFGKKGFLSLD